MGLKIVRTYDPAPTLGHASGEQIAWMLNWSTRNPNCQIHIWDTKYRLTSSEEMKRFVRRDKTDRLKYVSEYRDCDDYGWILNGKQKEWSPGLAFGLLIVPGHALNFCIDYQWKMWAIENYDKFFPWVEEGYHEKALEMFI